MNVTLVDGMAIVLENHTLGIVAKQELQILRASVIRGSPHNQYDIVSIGSNWRPATKQDFADFKVMWHPDYKIV